MIIVPLTHESSLGRSVQEGCVPRRVPEDYADSARSLRRYTERGAPMLNKF